MGMCWSAEAESGDSVYAPRRAENLIEFAASGLAGLCERLSSDPSVVAGQEIGKMAHFVHDVLVPTQVKLLSLHAHHLRMIASSRKKSDRRDAYWISKSLQTGMMPNPVYILTGEVRELRSLLQQRDNVIRERVRWMARARCMLQSLGHKPSKLNTARLTDVVESATTSPDGLSSHLASGLMRCQRMAQVLQQEQEQVDGELSRRAQRIDYVQRLQTIPGVRPQVAVAIYTHAAVALQVTRCHAAASSWTACRDQSSSQGGGG